jgi:hypothetical protein
MGCVFRICRSKTSGSGVRVSCVTQILLKLHALDLGSFEHLLAAVVKRGRAVVGMAREPAASSMRPPFAWAMPIARSCCLR